MRRTLRQMLLASALYMALASKIGCTVANPDFAPREADGELPPPSPDGSTAWMDGAANEATDTLPLDRTVLSDRRTAVEDSETVECRLQTYYPDLDLDGYGDPAAPLQACQLPAGYASEAGDCDDADADVHPGQTAYFALASVGAGTHDYDCDGVVELEHPSLASGCVASCEGEGWAVDVPTCGDAGYLTLCVPYLGLGCGPWLVWQTQRCR